MNSVTTTAPTARNLETPAMSAYLRLLLLGLPEPMAAREVLAVYAVPPALAAGTRDQNRDAPSPSLTRAA